MNTYEITTSQRINRGLFGATLILFTMTVPVAPLGWIAVLPLVATLPIFAAMFGYDPISRIISEEIHQLRQAIVQHYGTGHRHHHS